MKRNEMNLLLNTLPRSWWIGQGIKVIVYYKLRTAHTVHPTPAHQWNKVNKSISIVHLVTQLHRSIAKAKFAESLATKAVKRASSYYGERLFTIDPVSCSFGRKNPPPFFLPIGVARTVACVQSINRFFVSRCWGWPAPPHIQLLSTRMGEAVGKPYNNTMQWNESMLKSPAKPHAGNIWLFEVILSTTMAKRKMASHRSPVDCRKLCTLCVCLCERARCWGIYSLSFALFVLRNVGSERGSGAREDKKKHLL